MSTELAVQELTPQQKGWLQLALQKKTLFDDLQKGELAIQAKLSTISQIQELAKVQELLKEAKDIAATNKEQRLIFTNMLKEKLIEPSMEFEKRNEALIETASKHELTLRTAEWQKQQATAAKTKEVEEFKAHIINEYSRKGAEYRKALAKMITDAYTDCLTAKRPVDEIPAFLDTIRKFLSEIPLVKFIPFARLLVEDKECPGIFAQIPAYDPAPDLKDAIAALDEKFQMYAEDLKNAAKAIEQSNKELAAKQQEEDSNQEQSAAITNLTAQASGVVTTPGVRLKKSFVVEEENTEEWALNIMRGFLNNFTDCRKELGVRSWAKLSLGQMAAAIGKVYTNNPKQPFHAIKFKEVKK